MKNIKTQNLRGTVISCKCIAIDNQSCCYNAELVITDQMISRIALFDVTRECYDCVKEKASVVLCLKKDEKYITVITEYLLTCTFRHCSESVVEETGITIKYVSSRVLYGYNCLNEKMLFTSFSCEVTDGIELLGEYPFKHKEEGDDSYRKILSDGNLIYKDTSLGISYFVAPCVEKTKQGLILKSQYRIQYRNEELFDIFYIEEVARKIVLFFEIL